MEEVLKKEKIIRPIFITPLVYTDRDVNGLINTTLIESLSSVFKPIVLGSDKYSIDSEYQFTYNERVLLKAHEFYFARAIFKYGPKFLKDIIFNCPDAQYYSWYYNAKRISMSFLKQNQVSYLHSIGIPFSSHLLASKLKRSYGIPWVAQFHEPWSDNTYRFVNKIVDRKNYEWERMVAQESNLIIHNSDAMCESWLRRYGKVVEGKLVSIPMPVDFSKYEKSSINKKRGEKLRISHIGNLGGLRKADSILMAISSLLKDNPALSSEMELFLIGNISQSDRDLIKELKLEKIVSVLGHLTEDECVYYYRNSDVFLVIESKDQGPLFFPSKLIRYFYYQRPILGLTIKNSVLYYQLVENGHFAYSPNDIEGIKKYLRSAITNYQIFLNFNKNAWKKYDSKSVARQYEDVIVEKLFK